MAAIAANDVRDLRLAMETREPLVIVRRPGEYRVRPNARVVTRLVDLRHGTPR